MEAAPERLIFSTQENEQKARYAFTQNLEAALPTEFEIPLTSFPTKKIADFAAASMNRGIHFNMAKKTHSVFP